VIGNRGTYIGILYKDGVLAIYDFKQNFVIESLAYHSQKV